MPGGDRRLTPRFPEGAPRRSRCVIKADIGSTGDDIAILMTHRRGEADPAIHKLAWDAFVAGTAFAKQQGLYGGAGQDLLRESFSGNVRGMGPAVSEMDLAFADPMNTPGLLLAPKMARGFRFVIMDVTCTDADHVIELNALEELYDIAALLRDPERSGHAGPRADELPGHR